MALLKSVFKWAWFFIARVVLPFFMALICVLIAERPQEGFSDMSTESWIFLIAFMIMWNLWRSASRGSDKEAEDYKNHLLEDDPENQKHSLIEKALLLDAAEQQQKPMKQGMSLLTFCMPIAYFLAVNGASLGVWLGSYLGAVFAMIFVLNLVD